MSQGPPGSSWSSGARAAALDADSTRGRRFREILHGRSFIYVLAFGLGGSLLAGAYAGGTLAAIMAPIVLGPLLFGAALVLADRRAERDFFVAYAASRGLTYGGSTELLPLTPLLGAGDRRHCEHYMTARAGGLGHYTFEVRHRSEGGRESRERHSFTICVTDLEAGITMFPGIFLAKRHGVFGMLDGEQWLSHHNRHRVELESAKLCERFDLWVDDGQDELRLRELFAPSLEVYLADHPLTPCFEYRAGTLLVYVERLLSDEGHLDLLREASARIAGRITAEVEERSAA
jgi:hypothetical protein